VIAPENLQREGVLIFRDAFERDTFAVTTLMGRYAFDAGRGFVRTSRMKARLRSTYARKVWAKEAALAAIMWHSRHGPYRRNTAAIFDVTSGDCGSRRAQAADENDDPQCPRQEDRWPASAIGDPFLMASKIASSLNRK